MPSHSLVAKMTRTFFSHVLNSLVLEDVNSGKLVVVSGFSLALSASWRSARSCGSYVLVGCGVDIGQGGGGGGGFGFGRGGGGGGGTVGFVGVGVEVEGGCVGLGLGRGEAVEFNVESWVWMAMICS